MGSPFSPDLPDPDASERETIDLALGPIDDTYHGPLKVAVSRPEADPRLAVVDMVSTPPHYARFKIEPIRFIAENGLNWFQGNVVKYILRHDAKNGLEDIRKAIRYGIMYYRFLVGDPAWSEKDALTPQLIPLYGGD